MYIVPRVDPGGWDEALGIIKAVVVSSKFKLVGEKVAKSTLAELIAKVLPVICNFTVGAPTIEALILATPVANVILPEFGVILTVLAIFFYKYIFLRYCKICKKSTLG
jgi:hypothetical protein